MMVRIIKKIQVLGVCSLGVCDLSSYAQQATPLTLKTPQIHVIHHDGYRGDGHTHDIIRDVGTQTDFKTWLETHPDQQSQVADYTQFLKKHLGGKPPPMYELLTTARSWQECGYEPYEVPPKELWGYMLPTIKLYNELRMLGILPANTHIRSVYRNPDLNRCAGGAPSSKHMTNGAMDIWVPTFDVGSYELYQLQNRLCGYWVFYGEPHNFGLGLYGTGAVHLDTQGYRKWGVQFSEAHSICRYIPPKSSELYDKY